MIEKKYIFIGIIATVIILLFFGVPTGLIPTKFFARMIEPKLLDYVFFFLTSILLGVYFTLHVYTKEKTQGKENYIAAGGIVSGILSFGCPICNTILVLIFGTSFLLVYFEPLRPILGIIGICFLGIALHLKIKDIKNG